ncbi:MAG: 2-hydroxyacid dehydrogenase [Betaproteobacteria bacterium AqS2]|uniref:2-hydroxyacid dehydrogenase n=1 Tax=Candidatus Amphirhobacter heronislandensis TaxID=1732024 RepID=A0A930XY06_9GAMM|nr:2-hydroxyacid dehydrogenase [Betaproteobacteria bacterium AqS2]
MAWRVACCLDLAELPEVKARAEAEHELVAAEQAAADADSVDALITNSVFGVPAWAWTAPQLKIIACYGVGYDGIDAERAAAQGAWVSNTPGVLSDEVADLALGLMLALLRELPQADAHVRGGAWLAQGDYHLTDGLLGRRLGILGMGAIGREIAARAAPCKMEIAYASRTPKPELAWPFIADVRELAAWSDILCCVVPGDASTAGMVDAAVLDALGPQGYFVNVGRGTSVDEDALLAALRERRIAGAALDVYAQRERSAGAFKDLPNVLLSPHMGSGTLKTRTLMGMLVLDNIAAVQAGRPPLTPVNRPG